MAQGRGAVRDITLTIRSMVGVAWCHEKAGGGVLCKPAGSGKGEPEEWGPR